jgi:hypothetical protein
MAIFAICFGSTCDSQARIFYLLLILELKQLVGGSELCISVIYGHD